MRNVRAWFMVRRRLLITLKGWTSGHRTTRVFRRVGDDEDQIWCSRCFRKEHGLTKDARPDWNKLEEELSWGWRWTYRRRTGERCSRCGELTSRAMPNSEKGVAAPVRSGGSNWITGLPGK